MAPPGGDGLVQIGHVEVEPQILAGPGQSLAGLLAGRDLQASAPAPLMGQLPAGGWRVIRTRPARQRLGPAEVLAAPLPGHPGTWAMLTLARRDGRWILSADPGPHRVYPGQQARRQGLQLTWPQPEIRRPAGAEVRLAINLRNSRPVTWRNQRDDCAHVTAWLLDPAGQRLQASPWLAYARGAPVPTLQPGETISVPVTLATPHTHTLPAGRYGLDGVLVQLNLRSGPGTLILR